MGSRWIPTVRLRDFDRQSLSSSGAIVWSHGCGLASSDLSMELGSIVRARYSYAQRRPCHLADAHPCWRSADNRIFDNTGLVRSANGAIFVSGIWLERKPIARP